MRKGQKKKEGKEEEGCVHGGALLVRTLVSDI
jgi:hypothetical protein